MEGLVDRELALLGDLARDMSKLQEHPEWAALQKNYADIKKRLEGKIARELLIGGERAEPIDQRKVDYRRGYLDACEEWLSYPAKVVARFEKQIERKQPSA